LIAEEEQFLDEAEDERKADQAERNQHPSGVVERHGQIRDALFNEGQLVREGGGRRADGEAQVELLESVEEGRDESQHVQVFAENLQTRNILWYYIYYIRSPHWTIFPSTFCSNASLKLTFP